jgi:hypothetical protein
VEPYSLRRTNDENLLLFVVNDYGALRGYRVDRMAGARPTSETFIPRYRVEFESWTHVSGRRALFRRGRRRRGGELVQCLIVENKPCAGEVFLQVPYR